MRVITAAPTSRRSQLPVPLLSGAIDTLGSNQFLPMLLTGFNALGDFPYAFAGRHDAEHSRFEPCTGYRRDSFETPRTLGLRNIDREDPMRVAMQRTLSAAPLGTVFIGQVEAHEIANPVRRELIFERHRLSMRIGISALDETAARNFLCLYRATCLPRSEERWLCIAATLSLSLLRKHWEMRDTFARQRSSDPEQLLRSRNLFTEREIEVCCALLKGRTVAQIAKLLAISTTTARTYQQRAFARLGIRTRQQLFELIFPD